MTGTEENQGMSAPSTSPFLRLPGELRNNIYKFVTLRPESKWATSIDRRKLQLRGAKVPHRIPLLSVNHQIYAEAWPFVYIYTMEFQTDYTLQKALSEMEAAQRADLTDIMVLHAQPGRDMMRSAVLLKHAAASLRTLHLDYFVSVSADHARSHNYNRRRTFSYEPKLYARRICEDMYPLLDKISRTRGIEAAIALVRIDEIDHSYSDVVHRPSEREKGKMYKAFREALRKCIIIRQKWKVANIEDIFQGDEEEFKSLRLRNRVVVRAQK